MVERYDRELRLRFKGDAGLAKQYIGEARKYVGLLKEQMAFQSIPTGAYNRRNADNVSFRATIVGNDHTVEIDVTRATGWVEVDEVWVYISSDDGLRAFDMATGKQKLHLTGLSEYEVDGVTPDGKLIFMTRGPGSGVVRIDVKNASAFSRSYEYAEYGLLYADDIPEVIRGPEEGLPSQVAGFYYVTEQTLRALPQEAKLSPDGTRALMSFRTAFDGDVAMSGMGGFILADTASGTIEPLRAPICMYYRPHGVSAWAPDSQHFYLAVSIQEDTGRLELDPAWLALLTGPNGSLPEALGFVNTTMSFTVHTSRHAYVAKFTRDGVLDTVSPAVYTYEDTAGIFTGTPVTAWNAPDGYSRPIRAVTASPNGAFVFAVVEREIAHSEGEAIEVVAIGTEDMATRSTAVIGTESSRPDSAVADDTNVYVRFRNGTITRIGWNADFGFGEVDVFMRPEFETTSTVIEQGFDYNYTNYLRFGPRTAKNSMRRMSSPAQTMFVYAKNDDTDGTLFGFGDLNSGEKYRLDLSVVAPKNRYVLRHVRTYRRRA